jgi:hypothetical protein
VVVSPPATEETGTMGREIESRQGIRWYLLKDQIKCLLHLTPLFCRWGISDIQHRYVNYIG